MGVDASSKSFAWGTVEDDKLVSYGEFFFQKSNFEERLYEARIKLESSLDLLTDGVDFIALEKAVMVNNRAVVIKLAEMFGVIKSVLFEAPAKLVEVPPMSWQNAIGNPVLRGKDRTAMLRLHPEWKSKAQVNKGIRDFRKNKTQEIVNATFGVDIKSDNINDGIGIALFIQQKL